LISWIDGRNTGGESRGLRGLIAITAEAKIGVYASSGAFYIFLAIFPMAALLCSILSMLPFTQEALLEYLSAVLPEFMQTLIRDIVGSMYTHSIAAFSISAVFLVWSAGRAFVGVIRGLNRVYNGDDTGVLKTRGLSSLYMLIFLAVMLLTLAVSLFQKSLLEELARQWPQSARAVGILLKLRVLPVILFLTAFFSLIYKFVPAGKQRFAGQLPGAVMVSVLWLLLIEGFSLYLKRFSAASVYGSLATAALALIWIYWCVALTLLGGCLNVWLSRIQKDGKKKVTSNNKV